MSIHKSQIDQIFRQNDQIFFKLNGFIDFNWSKMSIDWWKKSPDWIKVGQNWIVTQYALAIFIKYTHNYLQNFPELDLLPKSTLKTNLKTDPISTKTKHFWLFSPKLLKKSLTPKPNETILITFQKSQNFPPCECVCKRERSYIGYNSAARVARVSCRWAVFQLGESSWLTHHPSLETCVSEWSLQHIKKTMKLWQNSDIFKSISTRGCEIMPDLKESERTFVMPENEANPGGATRYAQCFLTLKYFWSRLLTRCFCEKLTKSAILRWKYFFSCDTNVSSFCYCHKIDQNDHDGLKID